MPKMILTCGISASGKTSWAEKFVKENLNWTNINRDTARFLLFCDGVEDWGLYKFTKAREKEVTNLCEKLWIHASHFNENVVVSDTNLNPKTQALWKQRADAVGYEFEIKYFDISLEEAWKRNERRPNPVRRDVITEQWPKWLEITGRRRYTPSGSKPKAIIVDVDGTIAQKGDRGPFDWKKVGSDKPRRTIISIIKSFAWASGMTVVFLSGRDSVCRKETEDWLLEHYGFNISDKFCLKMRAEGDSRKDSIIKEELFWPITEKYDVVAVFDDRPQVVRMWKDLGLTVIDVSENYNEF